LRRLGIFIRAFCEGWGFSLGPAFRAFYEGWESRDRTTLVYTGDIMPAPKRNSLRLVRRSVSLPAKLAKRVEIIAKKRALSDNRILVELIEQGIAAQKQKERAFFQLAERFRSADDPLHVKQLGDELGRFVFGE
jgi:hypothetical protein